MPCSMQCLAPFHNSSQTLDTSNRPQPPPLPKAHSATMPVLSLLRRSLPQPHPVPQAFNSCSTSIRCPTTTAHGFTGMISLIHEPSGINSRVIPCSLPRLSQVAITDMEDTPLHAPASLADVEFTESPYMRLPTSRRESKSSSSCTKNMVVSCRLSSSIHWNVTKSASTIKIPIAYFVG